MRANDLGGKMTRPYANHAIAIANMNIATQVVLIAKAVVTPTMTARTLDAARLANKHNPSRETGRTIRSRASASVLRLLCDIAAYSRGAAFVKINPTCP